jgi:hypothetical protein
VSCRTSASFAACVYVGRDRGHGRGRKSSRGWNGCGGGVVWYWYCGGVGSGRLNPTRSLDLCCGPSFGLQSVRGRVANGFCRAAEGRLGSRCFEVVFVASTVGQGSNLLLVVFGGMVLSWLARSSSRGRTGAAVAVAAMGSHKLVAAAAEGMMHMMEAACSHTEDC